MQRVWRQWPLLAREAEEPVQRLWRQWHLPAWEGEAHVQRVWRQLHLPAWEGEAALQRVWRQWPLPAREAEEPVQRVWRQWHLPAREAEEPVQRLSTLEAASTRELSSLIYTHYVSLGCSLSKCLVLDDSVLPPVFPKNVSSDVTHLAQQRLLRSVHQHGGGGPGFVNRACVCACFCLLAIVVVPAGGAVHCGGAVFALRAGHELDTRCLVLLSRPVHSVLSPTVGR